jgi:hypothetical protein
MSRIVSNLLSFILVSATLWSAAVSSATVTGERGMSKRRDKPEGIFSGRITKISPTASLLRIKVNFGNMRYLNKRDQVEFWDEETPRTRCRSYIAGKSNRYILLKVPDYKRCKSSVAITMGGYIKLYSKDLVNNMEVGRELMAILIKKQLAIRGQMEHSKRKLEQYIDRVGAVNQRYHLLREQLEAEWREEIKRLEEDRSITAGQFRNFQSRLDEINYKVKRYQIEDNNLEIDRWSLDTNLFYRK